jgi:hypothetical protein
VCAELLEDVLTHHELMISEFIAQELGRKLRDKANSGGRLAEMALH